MSVCLMLLSNLGQPWLQSIDQARKLYPPFPLFRSLATHIPGLFLTAMKSPSPHSSPPRLGAASPHPAGIASTATAAAAADTPTRAGAAGARRSSASAALLPERPPHFLAATRAALASLEAPLESAAAGAGAAGEVAAGAGVPVAPPAPPIPNYALVEKRCAWPS